MMIPDNELYYDGYDPYKGMSDEERMKAGCGQVVIFFVMVVVAMFIASMFTSCKTQYVTVPEVHTDTLIMTQVQKDSVWVSTIDSIYIKEKGDTLLIERWHYRDRWRDRVSHDTIYKARVDSVAVPVMTESQQAKRLSWLEELMISIGTMVTVALACAGIFWFINRKFHFI